MGCISQLQAMVRLSPKGIPHRLTPFRVAVIPGGLGLQTTDGEVVMPRFPGHLLIATGEIEPGFKE